MQHAARRMNPPTGHSEVGWRTSVHAGIALLLLSSWALTTLDTSGKWIMGFGLPLTFLCWIRFLVHFSLVVTLVRNGRLRTLPKRPYAQILRGFMVTGTTYSIFAALEYLPQAETAAITFLAPLLMLAFAPWILRERFHLSRWIAALCAFAGVLIIIRPDGGLDPTGVGFSLLSALVLASQYLCTRWVAIDDPMVTLIWSGGIGVLVTTLLLPFTLGQSVIVMTQFGIFEWLVLLGTGAWGALGHILQIQAYRLAPASLLAPFMYLQIVAATALGWLVWGDFPDLLTWLGILVVCTSGIVTGIVEWRRACRNLPQRMG